MECETHFIHVGAAIGSSFDQTSIDDVSQDVPRILFHSLRSVSQDVDYADTKT
jgi:hypothetical protein